MGTILVIVHGQIKNVSSNGCLKIFLLIDKQTIHVYTLIIKTF